MTGVQTCALPISAVVLQVALDHTLGRDRTHGVGGLRGHGAGVHRIKIAPRGQYVGPAARWSADLKFQPGQDSKFNWKSYDDFKAAHADAAKTFLSWVASPDFATIYANALPGFFSLNSAPVKMADPLAQEFVSWRGKCKSTIRSTYQILSRGTPNLENETWVESANVINGTDTPEAAKKLQKGLDSWYKPGK